jgi:SAM-dependent methyltransferase
MQQKESTMANHVNWWSTFFSGLTLELQRQPWPHDQTQQEADFIRRTLDLPMGAKIADVPCGNGRLTLALNAQGFQIFGIDQTASIIESARISARERGSDATFEVADMRKLPWDSEMDAVVCFGNSFPYFDDNGNEEFVRAVCVALKPGGQLLLETGLAAESILAHPLSRDWYSVGDILMLREPRYLPVESRLEVEYTFVPAGQKESRIASYPIYTCRGLVTLFQDCGFAVVSLFGSLAGDPYALGSRILYLHARKE